MLAQRVTAGALAHGGLTKSIIIEGGHDDDLRIRSAARIILVASIPSITFIRMSMSTRSGLCEPYADSASICDHPTDSLYASFRFQLRRPP
jgi:hypothetical protein